MDQDVEGSRIVGEGRDAEGIPMVRYGPTHLPVIIKPLFKAPRSSLGTSELIFVKNMCKLYKRHAKESRSLLPDQGLQNSASEQSPPESGTIPYRHRDTKGSLSETPRTTQPGSHKRKPIKSMTDCGCQLGPKHPIPTSRGEQYSKRSAIPPCIYSPPAVIELKWSDWFG